VAKLSLLVVFRLGWKATRQSVDRLDLCNRRTYNKCRARRAYHPSPHESSIRRLCRCFQRLNDTSLRLLPSL
jgi:hypothetical protein